MVYRYCDDIWFSGKVNAHLIQYMKHNMKENYYGIGVSFNDWSKIRYKW